ncbi:MAG: hypothetical protein U5Q16_16230, partial [Gammaproteobacteria bacterium]|nr:hypothetical protein [Gammaproteobacteria bacterium]
MRRCCPDSFIHIDRAETRGVRDAVLWRSGYRDPFSGSADKRQHGPAWNWHQSDARRESQEAVAPVAASIPGQTCVEPSVAGARRHEALGQRDDASIAALAEAAAWHGALTPAFVAHRATAVADRPAPDWHDIDAPSAIPGPCAFPQQCRSIPAASANNRGELAERVFEQIGD